MELEKYLELIVTFFVGFGAWGLRSYLYGKITKLVKKHLVKTERDRAIMLHFGNQVAGRGHTSPSPVGCGEGKCVVFGSVPSVV